MSRPTAYGPGSSLSSSGTYTAAGPASKASKSVITQKEAVRVAVAVFSPCPYLQSSLRHLNHARALRREQSRPASPGPPRARPPRGAPCIMRA